MSVKRSLIRNFRRLAGTEQILQMLHQQLDPAVSRIARGLPSHAKSPTNGPPQSPESPAAASESVVKTELNCDYLLFPTDLLPFINHTRVSAPDAEVPLFLAETPHYCWIRERLLPGSTVLDVGANLGLFAIMMAKRVKYGLTGWVHAFEPSPSSRHDLYRMLACNQITNVAVHTAALSDRCGKAIFHDIKTGNVTRESSHLAATNRESSWPQDQIEVDTIDVDTFVERHNIRPQLIKIDVEGAEFLVLEGARQCIERHQPLLVIEIHPDEHGVFDYERLHRYLDQYGYRYRHQDKIYYCE